MTGRWSLAKKNVAVRWRLAVAVSKKSAKTLRSSLFIAFYSFLSPLADLFLDRKKNPTFRSGRDFGEPRDFLLVQLDIICNKKKSTFRSGVIFVGPVGQYFSSLCPVFGA